MANVDYAALSLEDEELTLASDGRGEAEAVVGLLLVPSHPFQGSAASQTYSKALSRRLGQWWGQSVLLSPHRPKGCSQHGAGTPASTSPVQGKDGSGQGTLTAHALPATRLCVSWEEKTGIARNFFRRIPAADWNSCYYFNLAKRQLRHMQDWQRLPQSRDSKSSLWL